MIKYFNSFCLIAIFVILLTPAFVLARQNSFTTGLGTSFDLRERNYDTFVDDPDTEADESDISTREDDDDKGFIITPLIQFISADIRDNFELRIAPDLRYDLDDSEWDWNSDFFISGDRFMTRTWQLEASNSFLIRDYYTATDTVADVSTPGGSAGATTPAGATVTTSALTPVSEIQQSDPQISPDIGNERYWRNLFRLGSNHTYKEDSLFRAAFDFTVLRGDEDDDLPGRGNIEDYDRYALNFLNEHSFSAVWSTTVDVSFVRGDFEETDPEVADAVIGAIAPGADIEIDEDDLSNDLNEYYVTLAVHNSSIARNVFSLSYDYIGARYEELLRNDGDIHQGTVTWRHDYSPNVYTRLGIGPLYEKTENRDENWGWNGIAELNYTMQHSNFGVIIEKGVTLDSFSGSSDRGFVDFWDARAVYNHDLTQNLGFRAELGYLFEERSDPAVAAGRLIATGTTIDEVAEDGLAELESYDRERARAGIGASYTFWRNFNASVDYFYLRQESDRLNDDYDDHRILLSISWAKELFRW